MMEERLSEMSGTYRTSRSSFFCVSTAIVPIPCTFNLIIPFPRTTIPLYCFGEYLIAVNSVRIPDMCFVAALSSMKWYL